MYGAAVVLIIGAATTYLLLSQNTPLITTLVVTGAAILCGILLLTAAARVIHLVQDRIAVLRDATLRHQEEIQRLVEQLRQGEQPQLQTAESPPPDHDEWQLLTHDIDQLRYIAMTAMVDVPQPAPVPESDHRVGVFVNLARRLQSLVHREIQLLDELETQVEDPDLLKGLFAVDHLATRIRRHAENLAVLGGAVTRRQWSKPVNLYEVLRSAVAEVERYSRVKMVRPIEGSLQGHAVADVIHLIAELVENATMFSNPQTHVLLRAERVTAGLAIEVEDRGLGMPLEEQRRANAMLAAPDQIDIDNLLRDGRIGLFVVSSLARRHGIAVQMQTNIYGGIQAVVVLPPEILGPFPADQLAVAEEAVRQQAPREIPVSPAVPPVPVQALPATTAAGVSQSPHSSTLADARFDFFGQPTGATMTRQPIDSPTAEQRYPLTERGISTTSTYSVNAQQPLAPQEPMRPMSAPPGGSVVAAGPGHIQPGDPRPPLPQRRVQAHLVPQLRHSPTPSDEPSDDADPGLMSAFQRGFNQAGAHLDELGTLPGQPPSN